MNGYAFINQKGSSLLTVIIIITLITVLCLNVWRTTVIAFDIALKKQQYEQQIQPMHGIMMWALDLCKNNFDILYSHAKNAQGGIHVEIPTWNINHTFYKADLFFKTKKEDIVSIAAHLYCKSSPVYVVQCSVTKESRDDLFFYKVSDWSAHNV